MILITITILALIILFLFLRKKKSVTNNEMMFSFRKYAWNQFKKNKIALLSLYILFIMIFIAIFAPQIANDKPLYAVYKGKTMFPALTELPFGSGESKYIINKGSKNEEVIEFNEMIKVKWKELEYETVVWPLITYSPKTQDDYNRDYRSPSSIQQYKNSSGKIIESPSRFRHHLGTDNLGRDLASGLIHGTRTALKVGLISMGIASLLGIFFGAIAGFFGDKALKIRRIKYYFTLIGIFLGTFYGWRDYEISQGFQNSLLEGITQILFSIFIFVITIIILRLISRIIKGKILNQEISVPIDSFIMRGIELLNSIPRLILIVTIAAVLKEPSLDIVMVIIGATSWTGIARFTRAELLRIRNLEYISASNALGFSSVRVF